MDDRGLASPSLAPSASISATSSGGGGVGVVTCLRDAPRDDYVDSLVTDLLGGRQMAEAPGGQKNVTDAAKPDTDSLLKAAQEAAKRGGKLPPVHRGIRPIAAIIDMEIRRDGTVGFSTRARPSVGRPSVRLFSRPSLKREGDRYVLVHACPKRFGIRFADGPFGFGAGFEVAGHRDVTDGHHHPPTWATGWARGPGSHPPWTAMRCGGAVALRSIESGGGCRALIRPPKSF